MNREELEKSFIKVQEVKKFFVEYMRDNKLTPSEGFTAVTGLLMSMYDAMMDDPTVDDFIETFGSIYKLHHALHRGDVHNSSQTLQ